MDCGCVVPVVWLINGRRHSHRKCACCDLSNRLRQRSLSKFGSVRHGIRWDMDTNMWAQKGDLGPDGRWARMRARSLKTVMAKMKQASTVEHALLLDYLFSMEVAIGLAPGAINNIDVVLAHLEN